MRREDRDAAQAIVALGEVFRARIPIRNTLLKVWSGPLNLSLLDFWGRTVARRKVALRLEAGASQVLEVAFSPPQRGVYKVEASYENGAQFFEKDVASLACFPIPRRQPFEDSFFGWHMEASSEGLAAQAARLGAAWNLVRLDERARLSWNGPRSRMRALGFNVLGQWFATPYQESAASAPPDLSLFRAYVRQSVRSLGEVRCWEAWNEPEVLASWSGSPQQFAALCNAAASEAHRADPKLQVLVAGWTPSNWKWHEAWAQAGGLKGADILSFHQPYSATATPEELESLISAQAHHWRDLMQRHMGRLLPLWDTQSGSSDTTWLRGLEAPGLPAQEQRVPFNWRAAAIACVQSAIIEQSLGIQKSFQYLWSPAAPAQYESPNAVDTDNAPKPKTIARATLQMLTDGARFEGAVKRTEARLWAGVWSLGGRRSLVCWWTGRGGSAFVPLKTHPSATLDIMGNELPREVGPLGVSEVPSYLQIPAPAAQVLAAIRGARVSVETAPEPVSTEPSPAQ